jgi:hypothetical protein
VTKKRRKTPYASTTSAPAVMARKLRKVPWSSSVRKIEIGIVLSATGMPRPKRSRSTGSPASAVQAASAESGVRSPRSQRSAGRTSR